MTSKSTAGSSAKTLFVILLIPIALVLGILIWKMVLGNPGNFQDGNPEMNPVPEGARHILGLMYKGGGLVGILIGLFMIVVTMSIERYITVTRSRGKDSVESFVAKMRNLVGNNDITGAKAACHEQKGSVGNVVTAGLFMYEQMLVDKNLDKERKLLAIQKELEEATTLELPMLSKNLVIISTIASLGTLTGLLGTVFGMIRAFNALAQAGAPDAVALSTGISEALWNTALGIITSSVSIIMYNYFTNKIDGITYGIDEAGYTIVQSFAARYKE